MQYEAVIGLEIHAQLQTATKLFCGCPTDFGSPPNTQTCPVCLGLPGVLPVLNHGAVIHALRVGLATACRIRRRSFFARKNYFYPDVPKNFQITQYDRPLCENGRLSFQAGDRTRRVGVVRIHLEEDAGKLLHEGGRRPRTLVDMNRAGVPLIEIVTGPDLHSGEEAAAFLRCLRLNLVHLQACDGNLEEGSLRCDANVSVRKRGSERLGVKVEVKNLNSFRAVQQAIDYEVQRQTVCLRGGETIRQETRGWDAETGRTLFMRSKEQVHDYRYFPEPDLPPLVVSDEELAAVESSLPELPAARSARLQKEYGLPAYAATVLIESPALADYFEAAARALGAGKPAANWIMSEVMGVLNETGRGIEDFPLKPQAVAELLSLVQAGQISGRTAKQVFADMIATGRSAAAIVESGGLQRIAEPQALRPVVEEVLTAHPAEVAEYLGGKVRLLAFFMGKVMAATQGRADPSLARDILQDEIAGMNPD